MRNFIVFCFAAAVVCGGCSRYVIDESAEKSDENAMKMRKTLVFLPSWGLETDVAPFLPDDGLKSRASRASMADYADSLLCVDYMDGTAVQKLSQPSDEPFSVTMDYGEHELRFIGHSSTDWSVDEETGVFRAAKVSETFLKRVPLTVDENTEESLTVQMERVVTKLTLMIQDAIPAGVARLELTVGGHIAALDMATGLGVAEEKKDFSVAWDLDGSYAGMQGLKLTVFSFCEEGEFELSLRVVARDAEGNVLADRSASGIPMLMNRCTVAKGRIFSMNGGVTFTEPGDWLPQTEIEI